MCTFYSCVQSHDEQNSVSELKINNHLVVKLSDIGDMLLMKLVLIKLFCMCQDVVLDSSHVLTCT